MTGSIKRIAKFAAQQTLGRLPPSASRLSGKLAKDGGRPVRDVRLRPWARAGEERSSSFAGAGSALRKVLRSGVEGLPQPLAMKFASEWATYCGCRYGLLLPHGTDALRLALAAALDHDGLDYGGEVIMPNLSFIATAMSALDRRFGIALVDVEPGTLLLDPDRVEAAIVPGKTRAIMPVHLFGQPANMTRFREIAARQGLKLIEDAAQAHGAQWENGKAGSLGDAAGFSFQSHKNLTCGEGGALTTNNEELFERAYAMHNVGRARVDGGRWEHLTMGWNCRPTEYQAALLLHRFTQFEQRQATRLKNFLHLRELLRDVRCVEPLAIHPGVQRHGVHMFVMRYKADRCGGLAIEDFLKVCGAEGAPMYRGYTSTMSAQPALEKLLAKRPEYFRVLPTPVADQAARELIYISQQIFLGNDSDMQEIAAILRKVENYYRP